MSVSQKNIKSPANPSNIVIVNNHEYQTSTCSCEKCVNMCERRPCWGTPQDIKKIMDAGYTYRLMADYWTTGRDSDHTIWILAPAIVKYELREAPLYPMGRCTFLMENSKCLVHEIKPSEGRVANCQTKPNENIHKDIAMAWDTREGKLLVNQWRLLNTIQNSKIPIII